MNWQNIITSAEYILVGIYIYVENLCTLSNCVKVGNVLVINVSYANQYPENNVNS